VLLGTRELIETAKRWRKVVGGGMRQAGMLAAAAAHALDQHVARLADDHARAARIAQGLEGIEGVRVVAQHTNMVFIDVPVERHDALRRALDEARIRVSIGYTPAIRLVTHLDVGDDDVARTVQALRAFASS
jgi:threonine aldolase